jgi:hypothetical protein
MSDVFSTVFRPDAVNRWQPNVGVAMLPPLSLLATDLGRVLGCVDV